MVLNYDIRVDLTPEFNRQLSPKFSASLGDHGSREYAVQVLQDGNPYEIAEGSQVSIVGKKSDGKIFAYECTYSDSYVYFTIEDQMTPVQGIVACELQIVDADGNKLGSANFTYWVEPSPVTDGDASESDLQLFQQAVDAAADLRDVKEILEVAVPIAEQIGSIDKMLTAFPTESATGTIATLTDGADSIPVKSLTLNLEPHQSGTGDPSPDNIRPISGYTAVKVTRAGKNLLKYPYASTTFTRNGVTCTDNGDGSVTVDGTATAQTDFSFATLSGADIPVPNGACTVSLKAEGGDITAGNAYLSFLTGASDSYTNVQVNAESTFETNGVIRAASLRIASGSVINNVTFYPMIRSASFTDATFEPYTAEEYNTTIPTAAGTVYGGKLTVDQDGTGTLTVDRAIIDLGSKTYALTSSASRRFYYYDGSDVIDAPEANSTAAKNAISSAYKVSTYLNAYNNSVDDCIGISSGGRVAIYDVYAKEQKLTTREFKERVSGWTFVYPLATPTTYTLTAEQVTTLLGDNTVWMDADGTVDVEYRADTQMYIDNKLTAQKSIIAGVETTFTATKNYSIGQYLIVGDDLYKVTAAIASGGTITVGTNVVKTTVAEQLIALASA